MVTLRQMREGLAASLAVIPDVQVSPYALNNPTPPTIQILGGVIDDKNGRLSSQNAS